MDALERLLTLQRTLARLKEAEAELETMPPGLAGLHVEHLVRLESSTTLETELTTAAAERRLHEAEAADVQTHLDRFQTQIPALRTQREYAAMLQEIDAAKARAKDLDDLILVALERQESATAQLALLQDSAASGDDGYQQALAEWDGSKPSLREEMAQLVATVATLRDQIPKPQLALFDRILGRTGGDALAAVLHHSSPGSSFYHCSGCHYHVRFQVVAEIRRGELRQCESCKRILFSEAEE